jgi:uncharacterized repeat protein (TIGR03803 family)
VLLTVFLSPAIAQTNFTILKHFNSIPEGLVPYGTLVADTNLVLYGTAAAGGITNRGTVFRINPDGSGYAVLKTFAGPDGAGPEGGIVLSANGSLYGTTYAGGTSNFGTVFTINRDGTGFAVLHNFTGASDGMNPQARLTEGGDGALYGTTANGNTTARGTIFKINKNGGGYAVLHIFTGNPDGQQPSARLLAASDGALYGTTGFGGTSVGTIFTLNMDGGGYNILHYFPAFSGDGVNPIGGLTEGSDHVLYGTAYHGGTTAGNIFKMNKAGDGYQILRNFSTTGGDGQRPNAELIEGSDGALYGGTDYGGASMNGTFYKLNKDGSGYAILHSFLSAGGDGQVPKCALLPLRDGVFYGTTEYGGLGGAGCLFVLSSTPLQPRAVSLSVAANSNVVQFTATTASQYDVQRSTDLADWSVLTTVTSPISGQINYSDLTPPSPSAYYRLQQH